MSVRISTVLRRVFLVWGGLSLVAVIAIAAFLAYEYGPGNRVKRDSASVGDVRFVLNWCGLGDRRIEKVLHSYVSGRSLTGEYLDAYAIGISHVDLAELTSNIDSSGRRWYRGDQLPEFLDDAVDLAGSMVNGREFPWFPVVAELRTAEFYVYPWTIESHGLTPTGVELIFIRPVDKLVFYIGGRT